MLMYVFIDDKLLLMYVCIYSIGAFLIGHVDVDNVERRELVRFYVV